VFLEIHPRASNVRSPDNRRHDRLHGMGPRTTNFGYSKAMQAVRLQKRLGRRRDIVDRLIRAVSMGHVPRRIRLCSRNELIAVRRSQQ
jgi:hypothetical protein